MAGTQDGDTVSLRSWDVDACHSAPIVTLVTLNLPVCIRSKNTVTRCASLVYDITDPTVQANGCPADMLTVTFTRQFVIVHEKRVATSSLQSSHKYNISAYKYVCALSFNTPELKKTLPLWRDFQHRCRWDQTAVVFAPEVCNRPRNKVATSSLCRLV